MEATMRRWFLPTILVVSSTLTINAAAENHFRVLHSFADKPAGNPWNIVFGPTGAAFGVSQGGYTSNACKPGLSCGTVFGLSPTENGEWRFSDLYLFTGGSDGFFPDGRLLVDAESRLYGITWMGGELGNGTVFELSRSADGNWVHRVLHNFTGFDGQIPYGGLIADAHGNLYGITMQGGTYDSGTVFKLTRESDGSWTESVLHSFSDAENVACPNGPLAFDKEWNLYGTATCGGAFNGGVVFKLAPESNGQWVETHLCSFGAFENDGQLPEAGVVLDDNGNIFGTTWRGGSKGGGVVFELSKQLDGTWAETILHDFVGDGDGFSLWGPVALDKEGNLYGSTEQGGSFGAYGYGTLFSLRRVGTEWKEMILHDFSNGPDGGMPHEGVTLRLSGTSTGIFGAAPVGGSGGSGVIYEFQAF
jgi:uncharacterized repeat protein (TIGR03803 family)